MSKESESDESDGDVFMVEKIVDKFEAPDGKCMYLIKWMGKKKI